MEKLDELKALLSVPQKAVVIPHRKPDADALGSCLGLALFLKKLGHQAEVLSPSDYPEFLNFLPGQEGVLVYESEAHRPRVLRLLQEATIICCLDFSDLKRIESMEEAVAKQIALKPSLLIDHHRGKMDFAQFELWDIKASATAELVYDFIALLGRLDLLDLDIAANLYAGIMTDTGSFKYSSTSPHTHRIAAHFMEMGLETTRIHRAVYDTKSFDRLQLLGYALANRLYMLPEHRAAYFALSEEDLGRFNYQTGDTEGLVNYALSIKGVVLAAIFSKDKEKVKISFRSTSNFPVNELAASHFEGGGHINAAGGRWKGSLDEAVQRFKSLLPSYKMQLDEADEAG